MTDCPQVERLAALVRGELGGVEAGAIEDHLERCEPCRAGLQALSDWALSLAAMPSASGEGPALGARSQDVLMRLARQPLTGASGLFRRAGRPAGARAASRELPPELPGFLEIQEVGRGGMGTVYRALQASLGRPVALKIIADGRIGRPGSIERFRRELRALSRLRHPNVVGIYDVGEHDGLPFLIMEWVDGGDLAGRLGDGPLPVREAAEIAAPLARAVQAAHDRGIIHRDLKPSNVLLSADEGSGPTPKIGDFGLAKLAEDGEGSLTHSGALLGTPGYMAPEQTGLVRDRAQNAATDVYGLGAILYEMLVGRPPFVGSSRAETIQQIAAGDLVPPRRLRPALPRDLETVCLKCLAHDPGMRYASAADLAEDLARFLDGAPVLARQASARDQIARWRRRRPAEARLAAVLAASTVASFASVTWMWSLAEAEARRAATAAEAESRLRVQARGEVASRDLDRGIALAQSGEIDEGLLRIAAATREVPPERADLLRLARSNLSAWRSTVVPLQAVLPHDATVSESRYCDGGRAVLTASRDGTARLWDVAGGRPLSSILQHGDQILAAAVSSDARLVATAGADSRIRIWDVASGLPASPPLFHERPATRVEFSPDGRRLAARTEDRRGWIWELATARTIQPPESFGRLAWCFFGPRGCVAGITADGSTILWSGRDGDGTAAGSKCPSPIAWPPVMGPDSDRVALGLLDGTTRVWDLAVGRPLGPPMAQGRPLAFSPDGRSLLAADGRGRASLWDPDSGRELGPSFHHPPDVEGAAFSPDGRLVVTAGRDHAARIWDAATGRAVGSPLRHPFVIRQVEFAPDGRSFLTRGDDEAVRVWDLGAIVPTPILVGADPARDSPRPPRRPGVFRGGAASRDAKRLLIWSESTGVARIVAAADGQPIGRPVFHAWPHVGWGAIDDAGARFATSGLDRRGEATGSTASTCQIFDASTGLPSSAMLLHSNWPSRLAFAPGGRWLATGDFEGLLHVWDAAGSPLGPPMPCHGPIESLAVSPDGATLAAGTAEPACHVVVWDLAGRQVRGRPIRFKGWAHQLAFSPDGTVLAAGSMDGTARLVDAASGSPIGEPLRHPGPLGGLAFTPDGATLVTATLAAPERSVMRSWDARTGRARPGTAALPGLIVQGPTVSADGKLLAAGCEDGSVSLWDVATMSKVGPTRLLRDRVAALAFDPVDATLTASDSAGNVSTWPLPSDSTDDPGLASRRISAATGVEIDAAGELALLSPEAWRFARGSTGGAIPQTPRPLPPVWHELQARDAEASGDARAARWHLDRLIASGRRDGLIFARRAAAALDGPGGVRSATADLELAYESGPRDRIADWTAQRAEDLRASGRVDDALILIERALAASPDDWRLHLQKADALSTAGRPEERYAAQERAVALGADIPALQRIAEERARSGRFAEAARLLDRATSLGRAPYEAWEWSALAHLASGDVDGYRALCSNLRSRIASPAPSAPIGWLAAHVCTLGPGGVGEDSKVASWAGDVAPLVGAIAYRSGRFVESAEAIRSAVSADEGRISPQSAAFLAMSLYRLGDVSGARSALAPFSALPSPPMEGADRGSLAIVQLLREAQSLIGDVPLPEDVFAP